MKVQIDGDESSPLLILAHGAGAGSDSWFMQAMTKHMVTEGICVATFDFEYMRKMKEAERRRPPERIPQLLEQYRSVVELLDRPCVVGGKSMGGRVASLLLADSPSAKVAGGVVLGYPFHPKGKPTALRVSHFSDLEHNLLICQGERDLLGSKTLVSELELPESITVHWFPEGDHDFKPLKKSGLKHDQLLQQLAVTAAHFIRQVSAREPV